MARDLIMQQLALRRLVQKNSLAEQVAARFAPLLLKGREPVTADDSGGGGAGAEGGGTATSPSPPPPLTNRLTGADATPAILAGLKTVEAVRAGPGARVDTPKSVAAPKVPAVRSVAAEATAAHAPAAVEPTARTVGMPAARPATAVKLPFLLVTTSSRATVNVEMDTVTHSQAILRFDSPFQVWDYKEVLKRMGLHDVSCWWRCSGLSARRRTIPPSPPARPHTVQRR